MEEKKATNIKAVKTNTKFEKLSTALKNNLGRRKEVKKIAKQEKGKNE